MAIMAGEVPNLADVIVASGAAGGVHDELELREALARHQENMPSPEELMAGGHDMRLPKVGFSIRPGEDAARDFFARHVETGAGAESQLKQRTVTPENPFRAQRYTFLHHRSSQELTKGRLMFEGGFGYAPHGTDRGIIRKWVMSVALSRLGEFNITETRGGVAVVEWASGEFADQATVKEEEHAEPGPVIISEAPAASAEPETALPDQEPAREKILLHASSEAEVPAPERVIRIRRAKDSLEPERILVIAEWAATAKRRIDESSRGERNVLYNQDGVIVQEHRSRAASRGNGDGIIRVGGTPAKVSYEARETTVLYGDHSTDFGSYGPLRRTEHQGSVMTIVFNPETPSEETLSFDFENPNLAEEVARIGEGLTIDGEPVNPENADRVVVDLLSEAGLALISRR